MTVKATPVNNKQHIDMSASKNRRLAAIFFAGIVDYSATMQHNEADGLLMVNHEKGFGFSSRTYQYDPSLKSLRQTKLIK